MPNHNIPRPPSNPGEGDTPTFEERLQEFQNAHPKYHFGDGPAPAGTKFHIHGLDSNSNVVFGDGVSQVVNVNRDGSSHATTRYPDGTTETHEQTPAEAESRYDNSDTRSPEDSSKKGGRMARLLSKMGRNKAQVDTGKHKRGRSVTVNGLSGVIIGSGKAYENGVDVSEERVVETRSDGLYLNGKRIQKF